MGGGRGWAAGGRLNPLLRLFGVVMSPRSHYHWNQFETHAFHVVPSMGPTVNHKFTWLAKLVLEKQTS